MIEQTKTCVRCKQPKPANADNFHKYPRNSDGLRSYCKPCAQDLKREWEKKNPDKVRAAKNRRNAANPEPNRARAKKWAQDNPERYKANMDKFYEENKEAILESHRLDRLTNPEKYREYELQKKFGITIEAFESRFNEQGRKCAGCGTTEPKGPHNQWAIDHDHKCCKGKRTCGKCIRGILCNPCNLGLGCLRDNAETLRNLARYLEKFSPENVQPCPA